MSIPKTFQLGGRTWRVKRGLQLKGRLGETDGQRCVIRLSARCGTGEEELHTFYHELMHAIAFTIGWKELNDDEEKIDALANLLLQFKQSAKP